SSKSFVDAHNKCCLWCLEHFLLSYPALSYNTSTFFFFVCVCVFPAEIREAFKVFDRDGNGFHLKTGAGMAMRSLGYMPNEVELEVIIQRLDMDGDGQVDFEEFLGCQDKFNGTDFDSVFWKCDMQKLTVEELKRLLYDTFCSSPTQQVKQTCVRKSLICAFAIAFIISVMLIAANQVLRSGMK
uniref:Calcium binding protein 7 n=1 Tax=Sphaeramia orbicularis TaxID=375764 RepID=A0A672YGP3_9TELE